MTHHVGRIYKLIGKFSVSIQKDSYFLSLVCVKSYNVGISLTALIFKAMDNFHAGSMPSTSPSLIVTFVLTIRTD